MVARQAELAHGSPAATTPVADLVHDGKISGKQMVHLRRARGSVPVSTFATSRQTEQHISQWLTAHRWPVSAQAKAYYSGIIGDRLMEASQVT